MSDERLLHITLDMPGFQVGAEIFEDVPDSTVSTEAKIAGFEKVHNFLVKTERALFKTQGATGKHGAWTKYQPHEMHYLGYKGAMLSGGNVQRVDASTGEIKHEAAYILQWGYMKKRLGPSLFQKKHADHIWNVASDGNSAEFGTRVPYAMKHQRGTNVIPKRWGGGRSPQRRVIDFDNQQKNHVSRIVWRSVWGSWTPQFRKAWRAARAQRQVVKTP